LRTFFLGKKEVEGYAKDLATRLEEELNGNYPLYWCSIGPSGKSVALSILESIPKEKTNEIRLVPWIANKEGKSFILENARDKKFLVNNSVLVIDGSVHSGKTMLEIVRKLREIKVKSITSYSLVIKQSSKFIPNFFGVIVPDHDRPYFLLDEFPNNRIMPTGVMRTLEQEDVKKRPQALKTKNKDFNKMTWGDLWYGKVAHGHHVYVYENENKIEGFISFVLKKNNWVFVDGVARNNNATGHYIGKNLVRWAETWARSHKCEGVDMWAIENKIEWYKEMGYKILPMKFWIVVIVVILKCIKSYYFI